MKFINPSEDQKRAAQIHYSDMLMALDIWDLMGDEPKKRTPARVVEAYCEFFGNNLEPINFTTFPILGATNQMVFVGNIDFASLCAHHHLPFFGKVHVAYYPNKVVCGLSKIPRVVEQYTHGALIQEDVVESIADHLFEELEALGVAVAMEAEHTCMALRGVRKPGHRAVSLTYRGCFTTDDAASFAEQQTFMGLWSGR